MSSRIVRLVSGCVSQQEIDRVVALDNQIRALQHMRDEQCVAIVDKLMSGCDVEPGTHHTSLRNESAGAGRTFCLMINGKEFR